MDLRTNFNEISEQIREKSFRDQHGMEVNIQPGTTKHDHQAGKMSM